MKHALKIFAVASLLAVSACGSSVWEEIQKQEKASAAEKAANLAASEAYLAQNKEKPGVEATASGLQYQVMRAGDATLPKPGPRDVVVVHYEGSLPDGKIFDSSYARNEPASFPVGGVIEGWQEALQLMHPGDALRLVIPPDIAYGEDGSPPDIPPNQVLIFKVELLGYQRPDGSIVRPAQQ